MDHRGRNIGETMIVIVAFLIYGTDEQDICSSPASPCRTVQHAVTRAGAGDIINIAASPVPVSYNFQDIHIQSLTLTFQSWMKKGALLACQSPKPQDEPDCDLTLDRSEVTIIDLDVIGCVICVTDSGVTINDTKFYSAQLLTRVHNNVTMDINGALFLDSNLHFGCASNKLSEILCQNNSLDIYVRRTSFKGPETMLKLYGPIQWLSVEFAGLIMDGLTKSLSLTHYKMMYFIMVNTVVQNMKSRTGITLSVTENSEMYAFFRNVTFKNNSVSNGVVYVCSERPLLTEVVIKDCVFRNNTAEMAGTAVRLDLDPDRVKQTVDVMGAEMSGNKNFESAAGIYTTGGLLRVHTSNFINNHVTVLTSQEGSLSQTKGVGGAINFLTPARIILDHCHFSNNTANWFGGSIAGSGDISIHNTFFDNSHVGLHAKVGDILFLTGQVRLSNITMQVITTEMNVALLWYSSKNQLQVPNDSYLDLYCPLGSQFRNESLPIVNSATISYSDLFFYCDPCEDGTYSLQEGFRSGSLNWNQGNWSWDFECQTCSYGGDCKGGGIRSKVNFWGYEDKTNQHSVEFIPCPDGYCCTEDVCESYDTCAPNRTGTLCGECKAGMSEILFSTECVDNSGCTHSWYIMIDIVLSFVSLMFFLYQVEITDFIMKYLFWQVSKEADNASTAGYVKSIFYFYQTLDLISKQENQVSMQMGIALMPFLTHLLTFRPLAALQNVCPFPGLNHITKTIFESAQTFYMFILLGILFIVTIILEMIRNRRKALPRNQSSSLSITDTTDKSEHTFRARLATACVSLFLYNYVNLSNMSFLLLACIPVNGQWVLYYDGNVQCFQPWQYVFIIIVIVHIIPFFAAVIISRFLLEKHYITNTQFILAYFLPLPVLCYWLYLWIRIKVKSRSLTMPPSSHSVITEGCDNYHNQTKEKILFVLEEPFINHQNSEKSAKYWEGVMIFQRLVLSLVAVYVIDTMLGMTLQALVCLVFLIWHIQVKPFGSASANHLESASLTGITAMAVCHLIQAIYFTAGKIPTGPGKRQIYVTEWIELVVVNALPALLAILLVIAVLVRLGFVVYRACLCLYRLVCRNWYYSRQDRNTPETSSPVLLSEDETYL